MGTLTVEPRQGGLRAMVSYEVVSASRRARAILAACLTISVAACAGGGGGYGDPGARSLPPGETCQSLRGQLDRLLAKGVQSKVEALSAGRALSARDKADAESYNRILNQYLGARCHVV